MIIHNRTTTVALFATALLVVLAGFGCEPQRTPPGGEPPTGNAGGTITAWAEYTSPTLGITIPYPEGWYYREDRGEDVTAVYIDVVPLSSSGAGSDAPVRVTVTATQLSLSDALAAYSTASDTTTVNFGSRRVTKVAYRSEIGVSDDSSANREAYHWEVNGRLYTVDGSRGDAVVEYVASTLAAQEE